MPLQLVTSNLSLLRPTKIPKFLSSKTRNIFVGRRREEEKKEGGIQRKIKSV
jgi:hypothetical protein